MSDDSPSNDTQENSFLRTRIRSFGYAFRGIRAFIASETHAKIHLAAAVGVITMGVSCSVSAVEWCILVLAIGLVLSAEAFNSAIETVVNLVTPDQHPLAGRAKDIAAGAVLIAAVTSAVVGAIIFIPKLANAF